MENKIPYALAEIAHSSGLSQLAGYTARVALSTLALAAGGTLAEQAFDSSIASAANYVETVKPVKAHFRHADHPAHRVEGDSVPYGYEDELIPADSNVEVVATTKQKDYVAGLVQIAIPAAGGSKTAKECVWLKSSDVVADKYQKHHVSENASSCTKQLGKLAYRYDIGHFFNCAPGKCDDGAETEQTPGCDGRVYAHEANVEAAITGVKLPSYTKEHPLWGLLGTVTSSEPIYYRFTALDNLAVMVRTQEFGWVWMSSLCVGGHPQGGPPNTNRKRTHHRPHRLLHQEVAGVVRELGTEQVLAEDGVDLFS